MRIVLNIFAACLKTAVSIFNDSTGKSLIGLWTQADEFYMILFGADRGFPPSTESRYRRTFCTALIVEP